MPEEARSLVLELTDGFEPLSVCWELNLSLLEEELVLVTDEPSFQSPPSVPPFLSSFFPPMEALMKPRLTLLCSSDNQGLLIPPPLK